MQNSKVRTEEEANGIALLRFSIIAPLVNSTNAFSSKMAFFKDASTKEYELPTGEKCMYRPGTIKDWYTSYTRYGFEALKPKIRKDKGESRKIPKEVCERIAELKETMPHITGKAIYGKLFEEGAIYAKDFSVATVYRYLNKHNLKYVATVERKQFEMEHANDCWQADTSHGPVIKIDGKKMKKSKIFP